MAKLSDILSRTWPGNTWTIRNSGAATLAEQYASLEWVGPDPQPSLVDCQNAEAATDAAIAEARLKKRQQDALMSADTDALLLAIEILADAVYDVGSKLKSQSLNTPLDTTVANKLTALRNKITQARSVS